MKRLVALTLIVLACFFGCAPRPSVPERPSPAIDSTLARARHDAAAFRTDIADGHRVTDAKGRHWVGKKIKKFSSNGQRAAAAVQTVDKADVLAEQLRLATMSDEEYARLALPSRAVFDGLGGAAEYEAELMPEDVERAHVARDKNARGVNGYGAGRGADRKIVEWVGQNAPPSPAADPKNDKSGLIFGVDNRWWTTNAQSTTYPYNTSVFFYGTDGGWSSGTLVGWSTAMGAGHGFWDEVTDTWRPAVSWSVRRVASSAGWTDYGTRYCYYVDVPSGYKTLTNGWAVHFPWDVAVISFVGCPDAPGQFPGWYNSYVEAAIGPSYLTTAPGEMHAYDSYGGNPPPGGYQGCNNFGHPPNPQNGVSYAPPSELTRTFAAGALRIHPWINYFLDTTVDANYGASGAGQIAKLYYSAGDSTLYYAGAWGNMSTHMGDDATNCFHGGRVMDWTIYGFLQANSNDY